MPESLRPPPRERVRADVTTALAEDIGDGDVTARLIRPDTKLQTRVIAREAAVLCGRPWFDEVFAQLDERIEAKWAANDGTGLEAGQEVCQLSGPARPLLSGERAALNFLQALSGCATNTRTWCDAIEGTGARILDTRKTLPGLRHAQKYAVRCGGAVNHRMGLYDAFLIKENHIAAAGGISGAVARAREQRPELLVEVEVETLAQLDEAVQAGAQRALLDNFPLQRLAEAVARHAGVIQLEASGGITLDTVRAVADTGVDFISVGALTKHVRAVDYSMRFI